MKLMNISNAEIKRLLSLAIAVAAAAIGFYLPAKIHVTVTPSLSHRVFWQDDLHETDSVDVGDYVSFHHTSPWAEYAGLDIFTKKIGCAPGDTLKFTEHKEFYCNDVFLGKAVDSDKSGNTLKCFNFNGVIPENKFFTLGADKWSYDSRYYGFVDRSEFIIKLKPLF